MFEGMKTQITLAVLGIKTFVVDFLGVTGDQLSEVGSEFITLALVLAAAAFRYAGTVREKKLQEALGWLKDKKSQHVG